MQTTIIIVKVVQCLGLEQMEHFLLLQPDL